ncbi:hypothetical protein LI82_09735 [Methanococcoides methylutens]|uniref:Pycsar effector protein domain-containing protein n=1 Tax=Methanococcoides methylutens TaxID=2226 RepID=A0A099T1K9_METMT|nr:hypothetical protein [Methanococcoides methylutens]KGK98018.1 hypothetical protein LI82_09735 [Methanococcoides methylutens]
MNNQIVLENLKFMHEILFEQYKSQQEISLNMESKGTNIVIFSGVLIGLLISSFASLKGDVEFGNNLYLLISFSVISFVSSILFSLLVYISRFVSYEIDSDYFINECIKQESIDKIRATLSFDIGEKIDENYKINVKKRNYLSIAYLCFFAGTIFAMFFILMIFGKSI